jgi:thiol-disulfide isomerase/thioredoxin
MAVLKYILIFFTVFSVAQTSHKITGTFPQAAKNEIRLTGYDFNEVPTLSQAVADANGHFTLTYPHDYSGAALLEVRGFKSVIILLDNEDFDMDWVNFDDFSTLRFRNSASNDAFAKGLAVYRDADSKRNGLAYLTPLYASEPQKQQFLAAELKLQTNMMQQFVEGLPANSYARYYLILRTLLSDMPQTASRYLDRMPLHEQQFNSIDFSDRRLLRSGLYKELLESFFVLLESYGAEQYTHINPATDKVISNLKSVPELRQDVAEYMFKLFEQRSLYPAAEHLALAMLGDTGCTIDAKREALFEQYRKMAKGNTAPDIMLVNSNKPYKKLSDLKSKYRLVIFGAGWCPTCNEEVPKLKAAYPGWKSSGLEIVYISLDNDLGSYNSFTGSFPWVTASDLKSWEGTAPREYFVSATPTMYLLDRASKIVLKPTSPDQVSAWLGQNK